MIQEESKEEKKFSKVTVSVITVFITLIVAALLIKKVPYVKNLVSNKLI